uniref:Uncharacterized protein YuzE n=1 Tax=Candidatus Kentrum eta TaxID=2126337 RepID=A0A450V456_9GAMM|nr:MAG: Uncharacterized protein YuzE [Candidatus Kentron sp. H]VFJ92958.1 MAG: Uncharacterized protein YuzE [Candidatus Kentron sp. H]VFJ99567.1 MAG: Uncharacterized protein YuzE [Candidatus Kentron sp. H]
MQVGVDKEADALYIGLTHHPIEESEAVADGVLLDYDAAGNMVGLEIPDASPRTGDPDTLRRCHFEFADVGGVTADTR